MWQSEVEILQSKRVQKFTIFANQQQLTYSQTIELWQSDSEFNSFFNSLLANSPFSAYFWETPPITLSTINRKFEFVLVDNPRLQQVKPNPNPFKKYFTSTFKEQDIVTFSNLHKDATLVVPCPLIENSAYTHVANFVRQAPFSQQIALWKTVGEVVQQNLNQKPIWVSTSGLGVYWLHIRLDSYPKYYSFQLYK
ncbi:DUF6940 family protein [Hyella patelloides]|nr:hypothetical protein [Hyella patelloides]